MIELTKSEVKIISGGFYYTVLGATLGASFMTAWIISAVKNEVSQNDWSLVANMVMGLGAFGAVLGGVVGVTLDDIY